MLLNEWQAWWTHMPAFEALEWLSTFHLNQASDAGWTMDRRTILDHKSELADLAAATRPPEDSPETADPADPWGLRRSVRRVFAWLKTEFGGGVGSE